MALIQLAPPQVEPVTLSEMKEWLKVDLGDTSQDNVLLALEMAARNWVEKFTRRKMVAQTWRLYLDFFPGYVDMKLAGQKVSSPFISGANAVLVGIRWAIQLPFPPVFSVGAFQYQNANGQVSSMILGSYTIAAVTNLINQPIGITTTAPHGLQSGASVIIGGNAGLLALLNGSTTQVITVTGANDFLLNGTSGTGAGVAGGGTIQGFNFIQDLQSNPARLTPIFGQMWPVARVVVNAINVDYLLGYATPIAVGATSPAAANQIQAAGYSFQASDVGRPISIPGAGVNGGTLNTVIASVQNPPSAAATLRDAAAASPISSTVALLVNNPNGNPEHWEAMKLGIKVYAEGVWRRVPKTIYEDTTRSVITCARDLRF